MCTRARRHALAGVRVDGPNGPKVLKVLRFDGPLARRFWYRLWGRFAARVQRVQRVQKVQRGRWPAPAGLEVMAACGGGLCRKGRRPFGPRVVVAAGAAK